MLKPVDTFFRDSLLLHKVLSKWIHFSSFSQIRVMLFKYENDLKDYFDDNVYSNCVDISNSNFNGV